MKNIKFLISSLILLLLILGSCSKQEEILTSKYWVRYKKSKANHIVKFKKNGDFIDYDNLDDELNYQIIQGRLIISDKKGETKKYFINQINENILELSRIDELGTKDIDFYRKARSQDLFLGKWLSDNPSKFYYTTFEANGKIKIEVNVNDYLAKTNSKYKLKDSGIIINKTKYKYKFSSDLMHLELIETNGNVYNLKRKK